MSSVRRPPGGSLGANLPYLAIGVVSLVLLVSYLALGKPFTPSPATTSTTVSIVDETTPATTTSTLAADTTISRSAIGTLVHGEEIFNGTCIACHGTGGVGIDGLGMPLPTSAFVAGLTDEGLVAFLVAGRPVDDPLNTTGVACPARGGNTSLTDTDLAAVVAYLRSIATAG
jgi:mono/diheme cytochrome c family protein